MNRNLREGLLITLHCFLFKLGFGITAGLFPIVKYIGDRPDEFDDYEAVGFYNDHSNGAIFSVLDNSGDQFIVHY